MKDPWARGARQGTFETSLQRVRQLEGGIWNAGSNHGGNSNGNTSWIEAHMACNP